MPDAPWKGDACSLVDAFREGERSPAEELEATLAAIEASDMNAFAHVDADRARALAAAADVALPFGGVPTAIKELEATMSAPGFYENHETARPVLDRHQALMWEVGELLGQWEMLQSEAEQYADIRNS